MATGLAITLASPFAALAQSEPDPAAAPAAKPAKKERKAGGTLSEGTYRQIERIQDLIAKNKNAEALEKCNSLIGNLSGDYEKAIVYQMMGFIYASMDNYKEALKVFDRALELDALPQQPYEQLLYNTGQMYYADGQHDKAIQRLQQYFAETTAQPPADAYIMLASLFAEKKRFAEALPQVDKAISLVKTPKESWVQLRLAIHYELKQFPACAEDLLLLISMIPAKEDYWKQLSSIFFEIQRDQESLAVLALAQRQGFIDQENEFKNLANIYMLLEIPYKAAQVLQAGLDRKVLKPDEKTLSQLGDAWTLAREYDKAEVVLKQLANISERGDVWMRLGQIYIEDERWKDALAAFDKALGKPLKNTGDTLYLAGVAASQGGDDRRAIGYLQKALAYDESRNEASQWLNHIRLKEQAAAVATSGGGEETKPAEGGDTQKN